MGELEALHTDAFIDLMLALMKRAGLEDNRSELARRANAIAMSDPGWDGTIVTSRMHVDRVLFTRTSQLEGQRGIKALRYWMRALGCSAELQRELIVTAGFSLAEQQREAAQMASQLTSGEMDAIHLPDDDPGPLRARSLEPTTEGLGELPERVRARLVPRRPRRKVVEVVFSEKEGRWVDATR